MNIRGESVSEILKFLGSIPLFSGVSETTVLALARAGRLQQMEKGEIVFLQADPCDAAYIVRTGTISIVLQSPDGREMIINEMRSGDVFGELGILTRKSYEHITTSVTIMQLQPFLTEYCLNTDKHQNCARYQIIESGKEPPTRLLPNGTMLKL